MTILYLEANINDLAENRQHQRKRSLRRQGFVQNAALKRLPIVNHAKHQGLASTANMVFNKPARLLSTCHDHLSCGPVAVFSLISQPWTVLVLCPRANGM
jgi:hypothetical protein